MNFFEAMNKVSTIYHKGFFELIDMKRKEESFTVAFFIKEKEFNLDDYVLLKMAYFMNNFNKKSLLDTPKTPESKQLQENKRQELLMLSSKMIEVFHQSSKVFFDIDKFKTQVLEYKKDSGDIKLNEITPEQNEKIQDVMSKEGIDYLTAAKNVLSENLNTIKVDEKQLKQYKENIYDSIKDTLIKWEHFAEENGVRMSTVEKAIKTNINYLLDTIIEIEKGNEQDLLNVIPDKIKKEIEEEMPDKKQKPVSNPAQSFPDPTDNIFI